MVFDLPPHTEAATVLIATDACVAGRIFTPFMSGQTNEILHRPRSSDPSAAGPVG